MPFNSLEAEGEQLRRKKERKYQDEAMQKYKKNAPSVSFSLSMSHSAALSVSVCECGSDRKKNLPQDTLYNKSCFLCNLLQLLPPLLHRWKKDGRKIKLEIRISHIFSYLFFQHPFESYYKTQEQWSSN